LADVGQTDHALLRRLECSQGKEVSVRNNFIETGFDELAIGALTFDPSSDVESEGDFVEGESFTELRWERLINTSLPLLDRTLINEGSNKDPEFKVDRTYTPS
jgi:hypothetical protein